MDVKEIAKRALKIEADAIYKLIDKIDDNFVKAVDIIFNCKGRLVVTGMGKSGLIGKKIASTFASTGTPSLFMHPAEGVHGDLGMLVKGDVVLAISNSGETDEIVSILPIIKRLDILLISIVGKLDSTLAKKSDCVLDASVEKEACPLNLAPTASTTAALAIGDALAVALLEKRGFKEEDFAMFHPSGSLGKKLLLKVSDIYHTGDRVPIVNKNVTVTDAILEMSSKGFGCTAIVDDNGKLIGIVTDGDLRRGLEKYNDLFTRNIMDIASKNPKTIEEDALAAKALQVMEKYSITSLLVVDEKERPYGIIHLHDILKAGVV
ncbi:KpsF/GutQ family sugar-phosphate isomerase [Deferribacter autotrophicus]|uniref:KpsF/GutQ family sugar-phosphate isomerase n=1 Tax=Deferribacter autotrophicus TaxID=500465 RepID=A0A5A8F270_9BACT|nr:KpsF/GutQ family sugar-phosphate isomerase [Deferribacter autotrophicus]KAA0258190.1 KpsF/GutQ family sugar-phosphate isomerase [Deferribacter autotrophicus]